MLFLLHYVLEIGEILGEKTVYELLQIANQIKFHSVMYVTVRDVFVLYLDKKGRGTVLIANTCCKSATRNSSMYIPYTYFIVSLSKSARSY